MIARWMKGLGVMCLDVNGTLVIVLSMFVYTIEREENSVMINSNSPLTDRHPLCVFKYASSIRRGARSSTFRNRVQLDGQRRRAFSK